MGKFLSSLERCGIRRQDKRLTDFMEFLEKRYCKANVPYSCNIDSINLDFETFNELLETNLVLFDDLLNQSMVIPDFEDFCQCIRAIYQKCMLNKEGQVASYIPQLAKFSKDNWAMSVCTVDGQRFSLGPVNTEFTLQSCSKPFTYAICLNELGEDMVHQYISHEPSGANFNVIHD